MKLTRNQILIALVAIVLVVIVALIFFLTREDKEPELEITEGGIEQPLTFYRDQKVVVGRDVDNKTDYNVEYYLYEVDQADYTAQITQFLSSLNKTNIKFASSDEFGKYWTDNQGFDEESVFYSTDNAKINIYFSEGVTLSAISDQNLIREDYDAYFSQFVKQYFGIEKTYTVRDVDRFDGRVLVTLSELIDGVPLINEAIGSYSDFIAFDQQGRFLEAQINTLSLKSGRSEVELVAQSQLNNIISRADYPKEVFQMPPEGLDLESPGPAPENIPSGHYEYGDIGTELYDIPNAKSCDARSVELVYYFFRMNQKYLAPTYRIDCAAVINYKGKTYPVTQYILASAIDPSLVSVPTQIDPQQIEPL